MSSGRRKKARSARPRSGNGKEEGWAAGEDERFKHVPEDPRFVPLKRRSQRVAVDKRFQGMFNDPEFSVVTAPVDKYGVPVAGSEHDKHLRRLYRPGEEDDDEAGGEAEAEVPKSEKKRRRRRTGKKDADSSESGDQAEVAPTKVAPVQVSSGDESSGSPEFDPARGIGLIGSSSTSTSGLLAEDAAEAANGLLDDSGESEAEAIPTGDFTARFALLNCDWDNMRAVDLFALADSFKPDLGSVLSVTVYPSEFGMERMREEDLRGPVGDFGDAATPAEVRTALLRKYQKQRAKYYYAVVECDTVATARAIVDNVDGREFGHSSVIMDCRFVPDEMTFDQEPRARVESLPRNYEPSEFYVRALQQTQSDIAWDRDDVERIEVTQRAFTEAEIEDMDFAAYLAEPSEESDEGEGGNGGGSDLGSKLRALLAGDSDAGAGGGSLAGAGDGGDGGDGGEGEGGDDDYFTHAKARGLVADKSQEIEITFATGLQDEVADLLREKKEAIKEQEQEVSQWEGYLAKKRAERKARRRSIKDTIKEEQEKTKAAHKKARDDLKRKQKRKRYGGDSDSDESGGGGDDQERAELELLVMDEGGGVGGADFDVREEKRAAKRRKKKGKKDDSGFDIDLKDDRFARVFTDANFAIETTNPSFTKTPAMKALVSERQERLYGNDTSGATVAEAASGRAEGKRRKRKRGRKKRGKGGGLDGGETAESRKADLSRLVGKFKVGADDF